MFKREREKGGKGERVIFLLIGTCYICFQLCLRENDLVTLPKEVGDLPRLRELHIQGNRLTVLPPEIGTSLTLTNQTSKK